jgi:hypothetical protein
MFSFLNKNKNKISSLDEIRTFLNEIPNINRGGCGVSAYAMYCYLEKTNQLLPDTRIIYVWDIDYLSDSYEKNTNFIENQNGDCDSCAHVVLFHNGFYMDSKNKKIEIHEIEIFHWFDGIELLIIPQPLTHTFMKKSIEEGKWNPSFDRNYIKDIKVILNSI